MVASCMYPFVLYLGSKISGQVRFMSSGYFPGNGSMPELIPKAFSFWYSTSVSLPALALGLCALFARKSRKSTVFRTRLRFSRLSRNTIGLFVATRVSAAPVPFPTKLSP